MIDWDVKEIKKIDNHYKEILHPNIDFPYFCRHFEEIYKVIMEDEFLLPDILNDITFYTLNGVNAKHKILFSSKLNEEVTEKLLVKRMKQRAKRQESRNMGMEIYYKFIMGEVQEFVEKYPFWKDMIRQ